MGWETRGNNRYYYRKEREPGGTVRSIYVGAGAAGELAALHDMQDKRDKAEKNMMRRRLLKEIKEQQEPVNEELELNRLVLSAAMIATGHYQHKRQWRKRVPKK